MAVHVYCIILKPLYHFLWHLSSVSAFKLNMMNVVFPFDIDNATPPTHEPLFLLPMCPDMMAAQLNSVFERSIALVARVRVHIIVQGHVSLQHLIVSTSLVTYWTHGFLCVKMTVKMLE
uniref:Uncharacterized protein n=1 Tax=Cacopsylla melanoneura TaxID=428564 RepID=A0A8D8U538_9HEMI